MIFSNNTDIGYTFYNDRVNEIVDASLIAEPFTYVPIVAGHMEVVGGNAIVFGDITEGEDVITPDISTAISYDAVGTGSMKLSLTPLFEKYADTSYIPGTTPSGDVKISRMLHGVIHIIIPDNPVAGSVYYITLSSTYPRITTRTASYTVLAGDTAADVKTKLMVDLNAKGFVLGVDVVATNCVSIYPENGIYEDIPNWVYGSYDTIYQSFVIDAYILLSGYATKNAALKCGSSHGFGIVYKDRAGRQSSVVKLDAVYIPFYTEDVNSLLETIADLKFYIAHKPPSWAETYEIVYFGNNTLDEFLQLRESQITKLSLGAYRYSLNISTTISWAYSENQRWKVSDWVWQAGDRIRLIGTIDITTGVITKYTSLYDYEIEETADQYDTTIPGDCLIFQAKNHPTDLDLGDTTIVNASGNLAGTVVHTVPWGSAVKRKDTITLTGTSGTANIRVGTLQKLATWNAGGLTNTASDFVAANAAAYYTNGITLTSSGADLIFEANVLGNDFASATNVIVEVYRPKSGLGQTIAYGCGMVFDIATDKWGNLYHKGDVDQVISAAGICTTSATVKNTANDCWKFKRLNYDNGTASVDPFWAESMFPSDWWSGLDINNKLTSNGFPFVEDLSLRQTYLPERIRNGGFILTGTRTNNLAHFTYDNFIDLPEKDGPITGLREIGYTLKVIQEHQETSIYISRRSTFNADGTSQLTLTDKFLGEVRPLEDHYGCQHPDCVMVNNRNLYYWDNNEGALIRSDANGQKVLSGPEYKMSRWFRDLLRWIQANGGSDLLQVRIGANNEHNEIWFMFRMADSVKGIIFSEAKNRFIIEYDQVTEDYVHLGNFFAHLYRQALWIINVDEGQEYLSWSGTETYAEIEVVSNIEPQKNKVFNAIAVLADHLMQSLSKYLRIPAHASGAGELMESNVSVWNRREGTYFGQILRDEHSPGSFVNLYDAKLNGRQMRGRYMFARFYTNEHTEKVRIDSIVIMSTPSERNV